MALISTHKLHRRQGLRQALFEFLQNLAWNAVLATFFHQIEVVGLENLPDYGPTIIVGNHNNQFVDGILLNTVVNQKGRAVQFLIAAKSWKRPFIGDIARLMKCIPVARAQDSAKAGTGSLTVAAGETTVRGSNTRFTDELKPGWTVLLGGNAYKVNEVLSPTELRFDTPVETEWLNVADWKLMEKIDQNLVYRNVWNVLTRGGCIGIFPEGGSHDRSEMLPLKAGVSIMALGALFNDRSMPLKIVPCGLNYYGGYKFRSRVVVQFGPPLEIRRELVDLYETNKRTACGELLAEIKLAMDSVVLHVPDYEALVTINTIRRMYQPLDRRMSIKEYQQLNQHFCRAYREFQNEPEIIALRDNIMAYRAKLKLEGLSDLQVMKMQQGSKKQKRRTFASLVARLCKLAVLTVLASPGLALVYPLAKTADHVAMKKMQEAKKDSSVKLKGLDVVASWKIMSGLILLPFFMSLYALGLGLALCLFTSLDSLYIALLALCFWLAFPFCGYYFILVADDIIRLYRSIRPLYVASLGPSAPGMSITKQRAQLQRQVRETVDWWGPKLYGDGFDEHRLIKPTEFANC